MLVIGLTGGIATGKSTVSRLLASSNIPVVDADVLARQVVEPGTQGLKGIVTTFGTEILQEDGNLDRKKLGSIIFKDEDKRRLLNKTVHPAIQKAVFWQVLRYWYRGYKYCVLDHPLLIETGLWKWIGLVVVVSCPIDLQLQRLMQRDGSSEEDALSRLNSQIPTSSKVRFADVVIDNSGSRSELEVHVQTLIHRLDVNAGWSWRISWLVPPFALLSAVAVILRRMCTRKWKRE